MSDKKPYFGWFEKKISKNTGKEYGSGSFSPQQIELLNSIAKQSPKGYVNFFWSIYQDKPSITLCEPKQQGISHSEAQSVFTDKVSIEDVPF